MLKEQFRGISARDLCLVELSIEFALAEFHKDVFIYFSLFLLLYFFFVFTISFSRSFSFSSPSPSVCLCLARAYGGLLRDLEITRNLRRRSRNTYAAAGGEIRR